MIIRPRISTVRRKVCWICGRRIHSNKVTCLYGRSGCSTNPFSSLIERFKK